MKMFICLTIICSSFGLCTSGNAESVTTDKTLGDKTISGLSNSLQCVHKMTSRLDQLEQASVTNWGNDTERQQLIEDIDREGFDIASSNGTRTVVSVRRAELLAALTHLQAENGSGIENTINSTPRQKQAIARMKNVRKDLAEAMAIPVWNGNKWIDGRSLAFNNVELPNHVRDVLVQLNYWEQNYGSLSIPKELRGKVTESGEASAAVSTFKKEIDRMGFSLELDRSLGIWKIRRNEDE